MEILWLHRAWATHLFLELAKEKLEVAQHLLKMQNQRGAGRCETLFQDVQMPSQDERGETPGAVKASTALEKNLSQVFVDLRAPAAAAQTPTSDFRESRAHVNR